MTRAVGVLLLLACVVLTGCGVRPQDEPVPIAISPPATGTPPETGGGPLSLRVYLVRGARLQPVERKVSETSTATAMALLVAGPTRGEVASGVRTAVAPQSLTAAAGDSAAGTVVITVTPDFTNVSGASQLLAVAQLVWTVTEVPGIARVLVTVDGKPVEIPTDRGLSLDPVDRLDYASVAPKQPTEPEQPRGTAEPTGTEQPTGGQTPASPNRTTAPATSRPRRKPPAWTRGVIEPTRSRHVGAGAATVTLHFAEPPSPGLRRPPRRPRVVTRSR